MELIKMTSTPLPRPLRPLNGCELVGFARADDGTYVIVVIWSDDPVLPEYAVARVDALDATEWRQAHYGLYDLGVAYDEMIKRSDALAPR